MPNTRPPVRADMTFSEFVATRPIPSNGWGDYVRIALKEGGIPDFTSWQELRQFVEQYRGIDIRSTEARAVWRAYSTMLRTAALRRLSDSEASGHGQSNFFMDGMPLQFDGGNELARVLRSGPTFERLVPGAETDDAVLVTVKAHGQDTVATVQRRLLVVNGSVSDAETDGPLPVPDALRLAEEVQDACKGAGIARIVVELERDDLWRPEWGTLV